VKDDSDEIEVEIAPNVRVTVVRGDDQLRS
jgi:hypothetical protein